MAQLKTKLDQEYRQQLRVANEILRRLPSISDQKQALYWVKKTMMLTANLAVAKKSRNEFVSFLLNVMRDTLFESALRSCRGMYLSEKARLKLKEEIRLLGTGCQKTYILDQLLSKRGPNFMCRWSKDRKTYVAIQPMVGSGALVYMAVSSDGWIKTYQEPLDVMKSYLKPGA